MSPPGLYSLFAPNPEAMLEAKTIIENELFAEELVPEFAIGSIIPGKILSVKSRGVEVELHPNMEPVFVPTTQMVASHVRRF